MSMTKERLARDRAVKAAAEWEARALAAEARLQTARDEALEEAAKVCDQEAENAKETLRIPDLTNGARISAEAWRSTAHGIGIGIRALAALNHKEIDEQ